jgi:flagellar assembly protein FliH
MTEPLRKFTFDNVFDGDDQVATAPRHAKRFFTADEVEQIRTRARADGERSTLARAEQARAQALSAIAGAARAGLGALDGVAHEHRTACAELTLASARAIAGAALERFPTAPAEAALASLAREIEGAAKLVVRAAPEMAADLQEGLELTAAACGFPGQIVVKGDTALPLAAFVFDWCDGRANFDPGAAAERVARALHTALAAEGLHTEPLISTSEADHGCRHSSR